MRKIKLTVAVKDDVSDTGLLDLADSLVAVVSGHEQVEYVMSDL